MKAYSSDKIRNIALIGHSQEGKTSVAEAMLYNAKTVDRLGKVAAGNSSLDFDPEEIARKISISLGVSYAIVGDTKINLLDCPGAFDFEGEVISALTAVENAVVVTSGNGTLSVGTEKALETLSERKIPAILFISGLDKENSSFKNTIAAITEVCKKVDVLYLPIMDGYKMIGYVDIPEHKAYDLSGKEIAIPAALADDVAEYNNAIKEKIAETSEELLEKYFGGEDFTEEETQQGILTAIMNGDMVIAMGGSGVANFGVDILTQAIIKYGVAPSHVTKTYIKEDGSSVELQADASAPFAGQIIKTVTNQFGKMSIMKIFSGTLTNGDTVYNPNSQKTERISAIYALKGKLNDTFDTNAFAGDIVAISKLQNTATGDTLESTELKGAFENITFPVPVISFAVSAAKEGDEEKVIQGLIKMQDEDATFKVVKNLETGETLVSGLGEIQLDVISKRVKSKFGAEPKLSKPRIAYRETIRKMAEGEGTHKKQTGGAGQFGKCKIRFEPGAEDGVFEFVDAVVGGVIPGQFIPAVEKGLREARLEGVLAGFPVYNLKCTVFDGKYHPVDSKEVAFISAAKLAYAEALPKASPCFLEPICEVVVTVPDYYLGDIMGDMNKRRGRILGTDSKNGKQVITIEVPEGEMYRYATDLRAMTQGRGRFTMQFLRYEETPANIAQEIIKEYKTDKKA